jgi:hypothetical protein
MFVYWGHRRYLAIAHDFTVVRIESRLDKDFAFFLVLPCGRSEVQSRQATKAQKRNSILPLTSVLDVGGWLTPRPGRFNTGKETR